jgi:hypothetical protein
MRFEKKILNYGKDSALLRRLGLNFLLDVFVYSLVSRYSCLGMAQVLLEFSLLGGWL